MFKRQDPSVKTSYSSGTTGDHPFSSFALWTGAEI